MILQGEDSIKKHFFLLESVKQAMTTTAMGSALLKIESELHKSGCLSQEWVDMWRHHWRQEIVTCSHLQESLLHVAALQVSSSQAKATFRQQKPGETIRMTNPSL